VRVGTFLLGALFILAGVVLFLERLGYSWWGFSGELLNYWPIILVIIGISLFWGGRIPRWLAFFVMVILVGGVIFLSLAGPHFPDPFHLFLHERKTNLTVDQSQNADVSAGEFSLKDNRPSTSPLKCRLLYRG
jgi:hypothetical protein